MPAKDFKFISPGVFINEIDNSQLPAAPGGIGPVIIGRAKQGPALVPTKVNSFQEFVEVFGAPIPGATANDVSREGDITGPTYGAYAAQAWLRNNSPVTYVRLVGQQHANATEGQGEAGWELQTPVGNIAQPKKVGSSTDVGGAYGLFVFQSGTVASEDTVETNNTGTLAAIWYVTTGSVALSGTVISASHGNLGDSSNRTANQKGTNQYFAAANGESATFKVVISGENGETEIDTKFNFSNSSEDFVRKVFNTNPTLTNSAITDSSSNAFRTYWLGETFEDEVNERLQATSASHHYGVILPLFNGTVNGGDFRRDYNDPATGDFIGQDLTNNSGSYRASDMEKLFKFRARNTGRWASKNIKVSIADIRASSDPANAYGSFSVQIRVMNDTDNRPKFLEQFNNCNLNPSSENFVARKIGDKFLEWDDQERRYREYGDFENRSDYVYIVLDDSVREGKTNPELLPFGVFGPPRFLPFNAGDTSVNTLVTGGADFYNHAEFQPTGQYVSASAGTNEGTTASKTDAIVIANGAVTADKTISIAFPNNYGALAGTTVEFVFKSSGDVNTGTPTTNQVFVSHGGSAADSATNFRKAIQSVANNDGSDDVKFGDNAAFTGVGSGFGIPDLSAAVGTAPEKITLTADIAGTDGNSITITDDDEDITVQSPLAGGTDDLKGYNARFQFPSLRLRVSASEGDPTDPTAVYYGVDTTFNLSGRPSHTIGEYTGPKPAGVSMDVLTTAGNARTENSFVFSLDDMCINQADGNVALSGTLVYKSGSRHNSDARGGMTYVRETAISSGSYRTILDLGADRFSTVLHGGFDGLDITEAEPFRNTGLDNKNERTSYAFNSLKVAIDSLRDPEFVEFDLAAAPGVTNNTLNRNLIDMCEGRGDALAVVDLKGGYVPETENTRSVQNRIGSAQATIDNKRQNLQINSSFGCAYYPWVQIQDTIQGSIIWAPPSVAAIGAMSYGQATQELWFAPAGFTRGGLSANAAAGIPVVGVRERLISKERDKLYEANINPIAQFPAEGIVIFGQKTLQVTPSALDRINVRRLLIFLKKRISRIAATLLFDQNVQTTWNRFRGQVEPFLQSVKTGLGLTDFKLVLDETTTTPDLIDRNVLYAQIFLKPARSIEFIAVDFVITDSGASFED
tara:strand:- start:1653 stop:5087 length:3435 start_codon:yes stop_codon:yes gene_type:complete